MTQVTTGTGNVNTDHLLQLNGISQKGSSAFAMCSVTMNTAQLQSSAYCQWHVWFLTLQHKRVHATKVAGWQWCITDTAKQRRRHAPKLNMSTDDVQTVPCRGAKQAVATHLDKGKPQDVVRHTVEPQRFQVLPVSAVAGDQELGSDEGCQGNCCPPGNHNGEHSCPNSHLQPTRPRLAQGHQP